MCCVLSNSIKNLKVLNLKSPSVLQARSSLGRSFHSLAAAHSNVDWPIAVLYLGRYKTAMGQSTFEMKFPTISKGFTANF